MNKRIVLLCLLILPMCGCVSTLSLSGHEFSGNLYSVSAYGNEFAVGGSGFITVFSVSNNQLIQQRNILCVGANISDLYFDGHMIYAAAGTQGLAVFDLKSAAANAIAQIYPLGFNAVTVDADGSFIFVTGVSNMNSTLKVIRFVSNGISIISETSLSGTASDTKMFDGKLIVAGSADWNGFIKIYAISDAGLPELISGLTLNSFIWNICVEGATIYLSTGNSGVYTIDASRMPNLSELGRGEVKAFAKASTASPGYLFIADAQKGVCVCSRNDDGTIEYIKHIKTKNSANNVAVIGGDLIIIENNRYIENIEIARLTTEL